MKRTILFLLIAFGIWEWVYAQLNPQSVNTFIAQQPRFPIPNVYGLTPDSAFLIINALGFINGTVTEIQSDQPAGTVIRQAPGAGSPAFRGTPVNLYISSGPPMIDVPFVIGRTVQEAEEILAANRLIPGQIIQQNSAIEEGRIIDQNPAPGTAVATGSAVDLTIANKEEAQMVRVPDVIGFPIDKARMIMEKSGFPIENIYSEKSDLDDGMVTSQKPEGGEEVAVGTSVILGVSVNHSEPNWPYWKVVIIGTIVLGALLASKYARNKKKHNLRKTKNGGLKLTVIPDLGRQMLQTEESRNDDSGIQIKIIPDKGIQTLKINENGLQ